MRIGRNDSLRLMLVAALTATTLACAHPVDGFHMHVDLNPARILDVHERSAEIAQVGGHAARDLRLDRPLNFGKIGRHNRITGCFRRIHNDWR